MNRDETGAQGESAELLELAQKLAVDAGRELLSRFGHAAGVSTKSSQTDPVSDADRAAEQLIRETLARERPEDGMLGEEGTSLTGSSGLRWVVDPLDGTVNYLYQLGGWCVSVAVEDQMGARAGVVYEPLSDRVYSAVRGRGAQLNGKRLAVNEPVSLDRALLATGFSYRAEIRARQAAMVARMMPRLRDIRRIGSAALDLCFVAAGMVDAYLEEDTNPWDRSAGSLIAQEAGARVTIVSELGVKPGLLVAGPSLHRALEELLAEIAESR